MFDKLLHKYLQLPYTLHIHDFYRTKTTKKTVVFLHGLGSSGAMWQSIVTKKLDANIIIIDLLGFGGSSVPSWAQYDAHTQARAIVHTLLLRGINRPVTIVGHSMGSLVAVELAKTYPKRVKHLVLCSPPFYRQSQADVQLPRSQSLLRKLYLAIESNPAQFARLTTFASKYKLVNPGFNVTKENISTYVAALKGMILNQSSFNDALRLRVSTQIIRGNLDPFVVTKNLKYLEKHNPHISVTTVAAGHEIRGRLASAVSKHLETLLARPN